MGLVLTRKAGESIVIGGEVCVTVVEFLAGGQVRLDIQAPPDLQVDRLEVAARHDPTIGDRFRRAARRARRPGGDAP